jgi:hydroxyethylthiazole kinase
MISIESLWNDILKIREEAPLVHNITNYVVMNTTANALLAAGASPVMAHAIEEVEEMVGIARSLVINIGTLSSAWISSMEKAALAAKKRGIPIVLDPVGAGATKLRTDTAHKIMTDTSPAIVRGNASEIRALYHIDSITKGVDSLHRTEDALEAATGLSKKYNCVVSISGEVDIITDGNKSIKIFNGHTMMTKVTGLGCTASALTGAFAAVNPLPLIAAAHAMALMGIAGEIAAGKSAGPASLQLNFIDTLFTMNESNIKERLKTA